MSVPGPQLIRFGRAVCGDLEQAERREWWLSNGIGGYAAGTVAGTLTRRYHGLLIAPVQPPLGRMLVFAKADATLVAGERRWPLFANRWPDGVVDPEGHLGIERFTLDGRMPAWHFAFGDVHLDLRIWLEPGAHTVYLAYRPGFPPGRRGEGDLSLRVRLLINGRNHHGQVDPLHFEPTVESDGDRGLTVRGHLRDHALRFRVQAGTIRTERTWYENFDLPMERERGLPDRDHHLCVGVCDIPLRDGEWSGISASLNAGASPDIEAAMGRFAARDAKVLVRAFAAVPETEGAPAWVRQLILAADGFLFARPVAGGETGESVIAGYPWFGDWGRDTMIALPGLTLATGRYDSARRILETYARFVDRGMLPNVFPDDAATPEYNTVDAALWYIEAWRAYVEVTEDAAALRRVFPVLEAIVEWHVKGTRFGIGLDPRDGLLRAGEPGVQLTWMDAKVGALVVTPRTGKAVEINALWYNALCAMAQFAVALGAAPDRYADLAARARMGFERFIAPDSEGLLDVLDGPDGDDATLRPNQILAVSLHHSPLPEAIQSRVVRRCGRDLLTSYGLRSLGPDDPRFRSRYLGGVAERDGSYHQGPVWAWLLGHYAWAEYRVDGNAEAALDRLEPIRDHLSDAGLGTVSEIFDGAPPHSPRGAPAQAWSVACVLEAWWKIEKSKRSKGTATRRTRQAARSKTRGETP